MAGNVIEMEMSLVISSFSIHEIRLCEWLAARIPNRWPCLMICRRRRKTPTTAIKDDQRHAETLDET